MHVGRKWPNGRDDRRLLDATVKNLKLMVGAGILLEQDDPSDRRRSIACLIVKLTQTEDETILAFGGCVVRLKPDAN